IQDIVKFVIGTLTLEGAPHVNRMSLLGKGLTESDIKRIEAALPGSFELPHAFNRYNLSEETLKKLGFSEEQLGDPGFRLLKSLGFSDSQIEEANEVICGRM